MKRSILLSCYAITLLCGTACKKPSADIPSTTVNQPETYTEKDIYYYKFTTIDGSDQISLASFKGKKILFVNTASYCGNTPQYVQLENLYKQYGSSLVIIGFPCDQFGNQEPGSDEEIKDFCTGTYHVTFPLSRKIKVKDAGQDPIYKWLTEKDMNGQETSTVDWNFQKYLIDENGQFVAKFDHWILPDDPSIIKAIED